MANSHDVCGWFFRTAQFGNERKLMPHGTVFLVNEGIDKGAKSNSGTKCNSCQLTAEKITWKYYFKDLNMSGK